MFFLLSLPTLIAAAPLVAKTSLTASSGLFERAASTCSTSSQSCVASSSGQNTCCFNTPGGLLLQTQFWDTDPVTGPTDSWTIHGLWPDNCDGTYEATCDSARQYTASQVTSWLTSKSPSTLSYMKTYWKDESGTDSSLWIHEWGKHGTCISTLDTSCYSSYSTGDEAVDFFVRTVALFKGLPTYTWLAAAGITPSSTKTYTLAAMQAAIKANFGQEVYFGCSSSTLSEIWYFHNTVGNIATGKFIPVKPVTTSTCPTSGIKYLPKSSSGGDDGGDDGGDGSGPTSGSKGTLQISTGTGCVLSAGTWSVQTCASFTATASGSGFTLKSSKGNCGVTSGSFSCGSGVTATVFTFSGSNLQYSGSASFSANSVPSGTTQVTILAGSSGSTDFNIQWTAS